MNFDGVRAHDRGRRNPTIRASGGPPKSADEQTAPTGGNSPHFGIRSAAEVNELPLKSRTAAHPHEPRGAQVPGEPRVQYTTPASSTLQLQELENWTEPFPRHWHDEWAIAVVEQGVNRFWHRGSWHDAHAGTVVVVPPGETHDAGLARDPWAQRMFCIPANTMELIEQACVERQQPLTFASPIIRDEDSAEELRTLHRTLWNDDSLEPGEASQLQVRAIGALIERHASICVETPRVDEREAVRRAKELMSARLSNGIAVSDVATAVGLSEYHFIREFHKRVGMTPHAYLKHLRIMLAQQLLGSNDPICDVALQAGFADQSHLTREFRRTLGVTPAAFRGALFPRPPDCPSD
jgi:AraC-like DNA-binding protein